MAAIHLVLLPMLYKLEGEARSERSGGGGGGGGGVSLSVNCLWHKMLPEQGSVNNI